MPRTKLPRPAPRLHLTAARFRGGGGGDCAVVCGPGESTGSGTKKVTKPPSNVSKLGPAVALTSHFVSKRATAESRTEPNCPRPRRVRFSVPLHVPPDPADDAPVRRQTLEFGNGSRDGGGLGRTRSTPPTSSVDIPTDGRTDGQRERRVAAETGGSMSRSLKQLQ